MPFHSCPNRDLTNTFGLRLDRQLRLLFREHDFGMKECAGYPRGNGDEFALAVEDFDLAGAGKFGEVDGTSGPDAGGGGFVGRDGRKMR